MAKDKALLTVKMTKGRETKGTHVYKAEDAAITSLYIRKDGLKDAPESITVIINGE